MLVSINDDFDLNKITESGQCFRTKIFKDNVFRFISASNILYIKHIYSTEYEVSCTKAEWNTIWESYFDLRRCYSQIRRQISSSDMFLSKAANEAHGIRILRQDPFEMLVSFIISQRKSIPAIKKSIECIAEQFGTKVQTPYEKVFLFPSYVQMSQAKPEQLAECKLGYRLPYILDAINCIKQGKINLEVLDGLPSREICESIMQIYGVGPKIANCVALFAYGKMDVFPIDTWIKQIIANEYAGLNPFNKYPDTAGIMQQYMFYYAIHHKREVRYE